MQEFDLSISKEFEFQYKLSFSENQTNQINFW